MSSDQNPPPEDPPGTPPPLREAPLEPAGATEGTGIPRNIAAALACILLWPGGLVFYFLDRRDRFVRLYSLQSIVLGVVLCALAIVVRVATAVLGILPLVGWLFVGLFTVIWYAVAIAFLCLWIPLIWNAYLGKTYEMPYLWKAAKRHIPQALL